MYLVTGSSASFIRRLLTSLSIETAEPNVSAPTCGTLISSKSPWMVPSSPYVPCRTGKATSIFIVRSFKARWPLSWWVEIVISGASVFSAIFEGSSLLMQKSSLSMNSHLPFFSMPITTTSYLFWSSAEETERADCSETSCSPDFPPQKTATFNFSDIIWSPSANVIGLSENCLFVILGPASAGKLDPRIHYILKILDPRFRGDDIFTFSNSLL